MSAAVTPSKLPPPRRLALALVAASFLDGVLTAIGFARGLVLEANPLLAPLLDTPSYFFATKFAITLAAAAALYATRARTALVVCNCVYAGVLVYHVAGLTFS